MKPINPNTDRNRVIEYGGKQFRLEEHGIETGRDCPRSEYFVWYDIIAPEGERIGRITRNTTEERIESLLYRYHNPDHLKPFDIHGIVCTEGTGRIDAWHTGYTPYIIVPANAVTQTGLRIDDEITITVTNEKGYQWTEDYHVSRTAGSLCIPLTRFKRIIWDSEKKIYRPYTKRVAWELILHTPDKLFLKKGSMISAHIESAPIQSPRSFDFAINSIDHYESKVRNAKDDDYHVRTF